MTTTTTIRTNDGEFNLTMSDNMPEIFADGISHILMGNPMSKLTFHSVTNFSFDDDASETRVGVLRLTIPTPSLLELCRNILLTAQSSLEHLSSNGEKIDIQIKNLIEGIDIKPPQ